MQHRYMYIDTVIDQLQQQLLDCKQLSAFTLLDPKKVLPQTGKGEAFQQWGSSQVAILEHSYAEGENPNVSKEALQSE